MRMMDESGSSSINSTPSSSSSSLIFYFSIFHNYPLITAVFAFALAQSIKFFTTWYIFFFFSFFFLLFLFFNFLTYYMEQTFSQPKLLLSYSSRHHQCPTYLTLTNVHAIIHLKTYVI